MNKVKSVELFYITVLLSLCLATFMVNKDEYKIQSLSFNPIPHPSHYACYKM